MSREREEYWRGEGSSGEERRGEETLPLMSRSPRRSLGSTSRKEEGGGGEIEAEREAEVETERDAAEEERVGV